MIVAEAVPVQRSKAQKLRQLRAIMLIDGIEGNARTCAVVELIIQAMRK
jgi:hypothetical protein